MQEVATTVQHVDQVQVVTIAGKGGAALTNQVRPTPVLSYPLDLVLTYPLDPEVEYPLDFFTNIFFCYYLILIYHVSDIQSVAGPPPLRLGRR